MTPKYYAGIFLSTQIDLLENISVQTKIEINKLLLAFYFSIYAQFTFHLIPVAAATLNSFTSPTKSISTERTDLIYAPVRY